MKIKISNLIIASVLIFSLAACTAKTTETTAEEQPERTERPERGQRPQNGQRPQGGKGKAKPQFADLLKEMDANNDGLLSKEEVKGRLKNNFDKVDTDNDGFITETEFKNMPKPKKGQK